jgi:hypothetical protein
MRDRCIALVHLNSNEDLDGPVTGPVQIATWLLR